MSYDTLGYEERDSKKAFLVFFTSKTSRKGWTCQVSQLHNSFQSSIYFINVVKMITVLDYRHMHHLPVKETMMTKRELQRLYIAHALTCNALLNI